MTDYNYSNQQVKIEINSIDLTTLESARQA